MLITLASAFETQLMKRYPPIVVGLNHFNGGLTTPKMVKVYQRIEQPLTIKGTAIDVSNWSFPMQKMELASAYF
jgi:hypothetical protein